MTPTAQEVEFRSYLIWEREGRPSGREWEHWFQAEAELASEEAETASEPTAPSKARPKATGPAVKKSSARKT